MKTVVVQSLWGDGILFPPWRSKRGELGIKKYCIPSVRRYADRHGYSYILHRPDTPHFDFPPHKEGGTTHHQFNAAFERFYAMNGLVHLYERFIYLDVDVYIKPNAPAMPYEKGVWAFHEWQRGYEYNLRRGFSDVPDKHQFNNGVLVMDPKGVKSVYDYLCNTKPDSRCMGSQDYFRLWSAKNKVQQMDGVWNHITYYMSSRDGHFIHYAGEKRWIVLELSPLYLRPFYWLGHILRLPLLLLRPPLPYYKPRQVIFYVSLKSLERSIRHTRIFQFFRRLWKNRRRS